MTKPKRNLFAELSEGFEALAQAREGKLTLRTHEVEISPPPQVTADNCSRCASACTCRARYLRVICAPTPALWRIGNRGGPNPTPRLPC